MKPFLTATATANAFLGLYPSDDPRFFGMEEAVGFKQYTKTRSVMENARGTHFKIGTGPYTVTISVPTLRADYEGLVAIRDEVVSAFSGWNTVSSYPIYVSEVRPNTPKNHWFFNVRVPENVPDVAAAQTAILMRVIEAFDRAIGYNTSTVPHIDDTMSFPNNIIEIAASR